MKTLLVTGGAGFIGSSFVRMALAGNKYKVINLDKLTYAGNLESLSRIKDNPSHIFIRGDIGDRVLTKKLLNDHRPCAVVNLAAESHVDRSIDGPDEFINTNIMGVFELLESVRAYWQELYTIERQNFRFLHVSTDEVYGSLGSEGLFTENSPYAPNSPYSASKAASDHLVRAYHHTYGLPAIITNCSNNYGPYQFPEKLVPLMISKAVKGMPLPVYGDGRNVRDWLYVEDHCCALQLVLEKGRPGEVYNIGGTCEKNNLEVVMAVCALLDDIFPGSSYTPHRSLIKFVKDRPGHDLRYAIDAGKIRNELGWVPRESFESGLRKTVRWYLENIQWCEHVLNGSYAGERLGLGIA
ncbi:dTDP-glucose 4,6-dehydratase [Pelotomaculum propionicicum]|uniref:dTDP-glucose 4,6-dehydratase n=1 Tax=Pelotomaculum propionicicum TaxID=258475 RepID=UPI003B7AA711